MPNAVKEAEADWKRQLKNGIFTGKTILNLLQVWNPSAGEGQNSSKANHLNTRDHLDNFWLCEYLKIVGFYHCAVPRFVLQGSDKPPKERKTFVLAPVNMTISAHQSIFNAFRDTLKSSSAVKLEILAALHYTDCFLQYCEAAQGDDLAVQLWDNAPENFVSGLHTAYYKKLGRPLTVMNLSFICLPHWMRVHNASDVRIYRSVIEEHIHVIRNIRQRSEHIASEGGEELALLSRYRDFLSANDATAFFDFTAGYAGYLMSAIESERFWIKPLGQSNLEVLLMNSEPKLKPVIESQGFQNIARAIRHSTVTLQYLAKSGQRLYDIRYGLGQELKRRANYPSEFIVALSDFLQSFNAENARVAETSPTRHWRRSVREDDITEVVRLIDQYSVSVVAHLLLAFGYASASKDEEASIADDAVQSTSGGDAR